MSFAPEATLHTWNVVEIPDDSTSSSNSNSTRRASSLTDSGNQQSAPGPNQPESPSSPDAEVDSDIAFSPVHHDDLQELRNRRTSVGNYLGGPRSLSSSPFSGSSVEGSDDTGVQGPAGEEADDHSSGSDSGFDGDSTAMSMDVTGRSAATAQSEESNSSSESSARLNDALRQAAQEAGTRLVDIEKENGDMSMEMADQEITGAFQPWIKKGQRQSFDWGDISALNDQENVDPSKRSSIHSQTTSDDGDEDMSMEVTNAIGGILSNGPSRRQSAAAIRRRSSGEETNFDDQTMELTNAIGGIAQSASPAKSITSNNEHEDEEMTMEFTSVVGGAIGNKPAAPETGQENHEQVGSYTPARDRNFSEWNNEGDDMDGTDMEMTRAIGSILPPIREQPEEQEDDQTMGMDVTTAMGKILPSQLEVDDKSHAKKLMELESDAGQLGSSPFQESVRQSPIRRSPPKPPAKSPAAYHVTTVASESGSPSLASVRSRRTRSSSGSRRSSTPISNSRKSSSPAKKIHSPSKQLTPQVNNPSTPGKTPPSSNTSTRSTSPKKLFQPEIQQQASPKKSPERENLFEQNTATGEPTPSFVLHPQRRRSSGLGIDKEGLGSPRVAAMLDSRRSIGEEIPRFDPQEQRHGVRFEDPVKLHQEVDREREEEEYREDGHINPLQSSERDATLNLREMISSLTPKKNKVGSRKSLHVGSARGLLGKRPAELDDDEDEESDRSPKRLKGRPPSPVKNVKLPAPATMDGTIGRSSRSPRKSRSASPVKESTTPTQEPSGVVVTSPPKSESRPQNIEAEVQPADGESADAEEMPPLQLQEFLNMTNIHFMELTTTKRRHTTAPESASKKGNRLSEENAGRPSSFEDCVAAGFCTVPMLELFQHVSLLRMPRCLLTLSVLPRVEVLYLRR